jgi:hypothetical protein
MAWVLEELERLGVKPAGPGSAGSDPDAAGAELRGRVIRRAFEIMREEGWVSEGDVENPSPAPTRG